MGFRVKSGVLMPSGSSSTYWVIITPGTRDLFLILTVMKWEELHYFYISEETFAFMCIQFIDLK